MRRRRFRLTARHGVLAGFALATLLVLIAGALATRSLLSTSLYQAADQEAAREARLVATLGLTAALSSGRLSASDLKTAASEYNAVRRTVPLTGAVIWNASRPVFAAGIGRIDAAGKGPSRIAARARSTGRTQVTSSSEPGVGTTIEAAVPLSPRGLGSVAEFQFSRAGVERNLSQAMDRLYVLIGVAALIMYLAILPLLARLARRIPLPPDPSRKEALAELGAALARRELVLHYQPKMELSTERIVGVEALVRWRHPRRGLLGPAEFLPIAEADPGLLAALTCQVLDRALRDCANWRAAGRTLPVAVNVAAPVLTEGTLVQIVGETLSHYDLEPHLLTLELTEGALMERSTDVTKALMDLRALGISLSIDDFGTGHSSLARLRSLPLDELKVDRSFIASIASDDRDLGITRHIIDLGIDLGMRVVAEGVEDAETLELLRSLGCSEAQGFHLSRPVPEAELREWLALRPVSGPVSGGPGPISEPIHGVDPQRRR